MDPLGELLATDHRQTLEFFFVRLKEISDPNVDSHELLYAASVLAHYAQTSTGGDSGLATPTSLSDVFDNFVADPGMLHDVLMMEAAGAQCLILAGFFEDQMRRRHNIRWYGELGSGFYSRAASQEPSAPKARMLGGIARRFERWRGRYARLSREMRAQPYLLTAPRWPHQ